MTDDTIAPPPVFAAARRSSLSLPLRSAGALALHPSVPLAPREALSVTLRSAVPVTLRSALSCGLALRFQAWAGRSGRRYVVSVHGRRSLPDFAEAVFLAVTVDEAGGLRLLGVRASEDGLQDRPDGRNWPELEEADEVHVHLLARSPEARAAVAADLGGAGGG